jgi:hypothetical protein
MLPLPSSHPPLSENQPPDDLNILIAGAHCEAPTRRSLLALPRFTLCLEAHASCAPDCPRRRTCPGKAAGLRPGAAVENALAADLRSLSARHPTGFALRLHRLGDFYGLGYLTRWAEWLEEWPAIHAYGATGWSPDSEIGSRVLALRLTFPERWWVRFVRISAPCSAASAPGLRLTQAPLQPTSDAEALFDASDEAAGGAFARLEDFDQGRQEPRGCRFILGDTGGHNWRYCQKGERPGSSYCTRHHALTLKRPRTRSVREKP